MYSNNILNFQECTTILNTCTKKKSGNLLNTLRIYIHIYNIYIYIYIYICFYVCVCVCVCVCVLLRDLTFPLSDNMCKHISLTLWSESSHFLTSFLIWISHFAGRFFLSLWSLRHLCILWWLMTMPPQFHVHISPIYLLWSWEKKDAGNTKS